MPRRLLIVAIALVLVCTPFGISQTAASSSASTIMKSGEAGAVLPPSVFFRGQSASIQARNSAGIRLSKDALLLTALVDTSGYSSSVQQKYQAYLITESPIEIGGHPLSPGAYGCGFVAGNKFVVMDIGGHDLFTVASTHDAELHRPTPLQILAAPVTGSFRLYAGRNFVEISTASGTSR
ncbi:hypothetical protein JAO29_19300 [Edaphobacter sp. HDX4]|uniref:hypothetical protein n=1 Tax=Edaphobacter sp. HDX4 TaxID=2794064 RepID=UPI002FE580AC